jgi:hypothetical protein
MTNVPKVTNLGPFGRSRGLPSLRSWHLIRVLDQETKVVGRLGADGVKMRVPGKSNSQCQGPEPGTSSECFQEEKESGFG